MKSMSISSGMFSSSQHRSIVVTYSCVCFPKTAGVHSGAVAVATVNLVVAAYVWSAFLEERAHFERESTDHSSPETRGGMDDSSRNSRGEPAEEAGNAGSIRRRVAPGPRDSAPQQAADS